MKFLKLVFTKFLLRCYSLGSYSSNEMHRKGRGFAVRLELVVVAGNLYSNFDQV